MKSNTNYPLLSAITILGFFLFRLYYIATTHYGLIADEAYFWDWSRHPDLSYYDMGPMVAWIIRLFTTLLPLSEFSVRLGAPVFSALTAVLIYRLAVEITESKKLAFYYLLIFHITPIATAGGVIMTYYTPQIFFMAVTAFGLWRLIKTGDGRFWYLVGAGLGLGFLSHHMFSIFTAEVVLFICLSSANRRWLLRKEPYLALIIELTLASPVFIWNFTHQAVMAKHAVGLMSLSPDVISTFLDFLGGQAGVQTPLFFLAVLYGLGVSAYRGLFGKDDKHLFLFCLSGPLLLFVALLCLGGRTEANWPISGYITGGLSALWVVFEKFEKAGPRVRLAIRSATAFTVVLGFLILVVACYPQVLPRVFGFHLPPKLDPANRLYGWETIGREASIVLAGMPAGTFVATRHYGLNGLMAFYMQGRPQVYQLPDGRRMSQYDFWNDRISVINNDAVFINNSPMGERAKKLFERVQLVKRVPIYLEGTSILRKEYYIYACFGYKGPAGNFETY